MKSGFIHSPFEKKRSVPLFEKDDCTDAGAIAEGLGEIYQTNPPRSPFSKGEVLLTKPFFQRGEVIFDETLSGVRDKAMPSARGMNSSFFVL
jgi:hypothetical protein